MINSKTKGSSFERQVARDLSGWVSGGAKADVFWRTAMSGGRATVALKAGTKMLASAGDLCAIDSAGEPFLNKFYIECKHRKLLNLDRLVTGQTSKFIEYFTKALKEAREYKKTPFFIVKQNRTPILLAVTEAAASRHFEKGIEQSIRLAAVKHEQLVLYMYQYETFLKRHPYARIKL